MESLQVAALAVIALAVAAVIRGAEVRLTLFSAALVIGLLADSLDFLRTGDRQATEATVVVRTFLDTFSAEKFLLPICSAMGFAYVLRHAGCDRHLVRLLVAPVRRLHSLLIPGVVLVAFVVNVPVISQTSTAVCVGPVVIPLMRAAGFSFLTAAATLCLGASIGGELFNPGAPELQTISAKTGTAATTLSREVIPPLILPCLATALVVHWLLTRRIERRYPSPPEVLTVAHNEPIHYFKALVPLVPLVFLFLTGPPLQVIAIEKTALVAVNPKYDAATNDKMIGEKYDARLIGLAMLLGVLAASLASPRQAKDSMKQFFEGAGYGFAVIVSLIVTANCFGKAIEIAKFSETLGAIVAHEPGLLTPLAALAPFAFAFISGSGMASTQSLYGFFHEPAVVLGEDADSLGAVVSIASAAGRTMSPVAAVVLMCATLTNSKPFDIVKRLALPLAAGVTVAVALRVAKAV